MLPNRNDGVEGVKSNRLRLSTPSTGSPDEGGPAPSSYIRVARIAVNQSPEFEPIERSCESLVNAE
jgi:hypothetical protein